MASPRKHPSLYPVILTDLLSGLSISVSFPTPLQAINFRYQFYAFREALRKYPSYDPNLLYRANHTRLKVKGSTLHVIKSDTLP